MSWISYLIGRFSGGHQWPVLGGHRGLALDRAAEIQLPPVRRAVRNRLAERHRSEPVIPDNRPVRGPLSRITPLEIVQVRRTPEEPLFNSLME
jgi:hypothetical protein